MTTAADLEGAFNRVSDYLAIRNARLDRDPDVVDAVFPYDLRVADLAALLDAIDNRGRTIAAQFNGDLEITGTLVDSVVAWEGSKVDVLVTVFEDDSGEVAVRDPAYQRWSPPVRLKADWA